jgi:hypothetical protein
MMRVSFFIISLFPIYGYVIKYDKDWGPKGKSISASKTTSIHSFNINKYVCLPKAADNWFIHYNVE